MQQVRKLRENVWNKDDPKKVWNFYTKANGGGAITRAISVGTKGVG